MSCRIYGHLFSSYTQKVLIALYETAVPFQFCPIGHDTPQHAAAWISRWPLQQFPILVQDDRTVAESSIIIEHLQLTHPATAKLIPDDAQAALDVRFLDRVFDLHVMSPMQRAVEGALSGDPAKRSDGLATAVVKLERAYAWLDTTLAGRTWATGDVFTLADCAAAPALFYADWTHPISDRYATLRAYRARLLARPSVARCINDARPFRPLFPLRAPDRD